MSFPHDSAVQSRQEHLGAMIVGATKKPMTSLLISKQQYGAALPPPSVAFRF